MIQPASGRQEGRRQHLLVAALLALAALLASLGVWQVKRLAWKEALIARVDAGLRAAPVGADTLPALSPSQAKDMEYRRLDLQGQWIAQDTVLVTGSSPFGTGYWAVTPIRLAGRQVIYVNRGFVPMGTTLASVIAATPAGIVDVVGLLRVNEPKGSLMRANDPAAGLWFSRDVAAMAARQHLPAQTAWFIDAQSIGPLAAHADTDPLAKQPVAGLTVISFPNNHLGYAITWFTLALLCLGAIVLVRRYRA